MNAVCVPSFMRAATWPHAIENGLLTNTLHTYDDRGHDHGCAS